MTSLEGCEKAFRLHRLLVATDLQAAREGSHQRTSPEIQRETLPKCSSSSLSSSRRKLEGHRMGSWRWLYCHIRIANRVKLWDLKDDCCVLGLHQAASGS